MSRELPNPSKQIGDYYETYRKQGFGAVMPSEVKPAKIPVLGEQHFDTPPVPPAANVKISTPTQEDRYHKTYREQGMEKVIELIEVDPGERTKRNQEAS